jgi:hypothetical protein
VVFSLRVMVKVVVVPLVVLVTLNVLAAQAEPCSAASAAIVSTRARTFVRIMFSRLIAFFI